MDDIPRSIIFIFILILGGGFFSAAETCYSFCNGVRIRLMAEDGDRKAKRVVRLLDDFDRTVVTLLIAINIIHVVASSIAAMIAIKLLGDVGSVVSTVVMTLLVFFLSEAIPKNIAKTNADRLSLAISGVITFFYYLFTPLSLLFLALGKLAKRLMRIKDDEPAISEDDFATMIEDVEGEGLIEPEEKEIIKSAIEFGDLTTEEVMLPADKISYIPINASPEKVKATVLEEKYSRFPVIDGNIDHIVGILQSTTILWNYVNDKKFKLKDLLTRPFYVRPETPVRDVFEEMGKRRTHIAIVRNKQGKNVGLITMEDILEEIVGEIYDEDDEPSQTEGGVGI